MTLFAEPCSHTNTTVEEVTAGVGWMVCVAAVEASSNNNMICLFIVSSQRSGVVHQQADDAGSQNQ